MADSNAQNKQDASQPASPGINNREGPHAMRRGWPTPVFRDLFSSNPFTLMRRLNEEIERAFGFPTLGMRGHGEWIPAVDIAEREGELRIHADLPGVERDKVTVGVSGNVLNITGERRQEHEDEAGGIHRIERSYGSFSRAIPLPEGAKVEDAKANFNNGVLEIRVPLAVSQNTRQIPISVGTSEPMPVAKEISSEAGQTKETKIA
jgi:HSP20 family protein